MRFWKKSRVVGISGVKGQVKSYKVYRNRYTAKRALAAFKKSDDSAWMKIMTLNSKPRVRAYGRRK